jgi:hypothetical protein
MGAPQRETQLGPDGPVGYTETPGEPMIESDGVFFQKVPDLDDFISADGVTVQLDLRDGSRFVLSDAWFSGSGSMDNTTGRMEVKWTGRKGEMVR